jgi:hypothetical protein
MSLKSIDEVIIELSLIVDRASEDNSRVGYFAAMYRKVLLELSPPHAAASRTRTVKTASAPMRGFVASRSLPGLSIRRGCLADLSTVNTARSNLCAHAQLAGRGYAVSAHYDPDRSAGDVNRRSPRLLRGLRLLRSSGRIVSR